jgi:hypothetical protein
MTIDFELLHKPFAKHEVKTRPGSGGITITYITARHVMNRLDNACGPENWYNEFAPSITGEGIQCTIYIRIDGEWIGKTDVGTESNIEEEKGAHSDAIKRAGVLWGIGRELYQDGLSDLAKRNKQSAPEPRQTRETAPQSDDSPPPDTELGEVVWTRNENGEVHKFVSWAAAEWVEMGVTTKSTSHTYNRLAQVLGLPGVAGKQAAFYVEILKYTGSKQDAIDAVRGYVEKDGE